MEIMEDMIDRDGINGITGVDNALMGANAMIIPEVAVMQEIISLMLQRMELFLFMQRTVAIKAL